MHIIKKIHIEKFRAFENVDIPLDKDVVAIAGQNGAMKTTLLGLLAQPFSLEKKGHAMYHAKTIEGTNFKSGLREKFKFSPFFDPIGTHKWTLEITQEIYPEKKFTCISINRNSKKPYDIRFWSDDRSRKAGTGYVQCPVVFLSLKRLLPIGEIEKIIDTPLNLSPEEISFFKNNYNRILISQDAITNVHHLSGRDKSSLGPDTEYSDSLTISAGQDNIGKILLAVLSFKRLQQKYANDYKGGMIFIDELETTLYPAAQIRLLEFMFRFASKYKLQFFFTTHSPTILEYLKTSKYSQETAVVYLKRIAKNISVFSNLSWKNIDAHLTMDLLGKNNIKEPKIKVYAEDDVAFLFLKKLLPAKIKNKLDLEVKITLGAQLYRTLLERGIDEFCNNIVLLDGDMRKDKNFNSCFMKKYKNVIFLPGDDFPEKELLKELWFLPEDDLFWDNTPGSYDRQKCFIKFAEFPSEKKDIKDWFKEQKTYAGANYSKFLKKYLENHGDEKNNFIRNFIMVYNTIAQKTGFDLLSTEDVERQTLTLETREDSE